MTTGAAMMLGVTSAAQDQKQEVVKTWKRSSTSGYLAS
jgi:ribosomal protein S19